MNWGTTSSLLNFFLFLFGVREVHKSVAVSYTVKRVVIGEEEVVTVLMKSR